MALNFFLPENRLSNTRLTKRQKVSNNCSILFQPSGGVWIEVIVYHIYHAFLFFFCLIVRSGAYQFPGGLNIHYTGLPSLLLW